MTFHEHATHGYDSGGSISVGSFTRGDCGVVVDGPNGLETVIRFNQIELEDRQIIFQAYTAEGRTIQTGSLEGGPENYGAVGNWLTEFATGTDPTEAVA